MPKQSSVQNFPLMYILLQSDVIDFSLVLISVEQLEMKHLYIYIYIYIYIFIYSIYKWADANNMAFNSNKFKYVCFTPSESVSHSNVYLCPKMNLIDKVENIKDLGITMSSDCNFTQHINNVYKQCSRLLGWILVLVDYLAGLQEEHNAKVGIYF